MPDGADEQTRAAIAAARAVASEQGLITTEPRIVGDGSNRIVWLHPAPICFGPLAWDVVGLVEDARERKGDAFANQVLAAYGRDVDPGLAQLVQDVQRLYGTLWRRYVASTSPARHSRVARRLQG